ncbi:uncharacterized protein LOC106869328 isoform X2 [Octopus bimaculoides]|uniref:G-protein coupled receptors family 1 profile domain-containing protein n=1 Tax=Octopus bimaculoides TaxID=37653 RepID=A0A0L8HR87_OCTBM|nr:uncharacterized protein LOC106869328 isoform X2 [Octopus bimaculoides]XP_052830113.1 uncharacterized protein LOC106869328 isoform X2 [Octopus bimaculoides]|eukprot:XP_014770522.1 PREDICTED: uncharacterized protein LOC106869328 isoform X3 [Octopus bimaculoides]
MENMSANYSYDYDYKVSVFGNDAVGRLNIFICISIIIVILFNVFLMVAIFLDRKSHGKTRSLSLLNYLLNYALVALFVYFQSLHVFIVRDLPKSHCLFITILAFVVNDGDKYFLIPLCCDFIMKYFRPSKYENQIFLIIQSVLIGILWVLICIKNLVLILAFSNLSTNSCFFYLYINAIVAQFVISILLLIAMLVFIGLLIYIAIKSKEQEMMKSPLITLIIITAVTIILLILTTLNDAGFMGHYRSPLFVMYRVMSLGSFLLLPFLWSFDFTIRQSIRKLCSEKCKKHKDHPSHELTEIN